MSRFSNDRIKNLTPYTPGEQPKERKYIKLNTNESPYPPSENAVKKAREIADSLMLYSDPESRALTEKMAEVLGVSYDEVLMTNGSDEILNFAFMAFCDKNTPAVFPDITYGFYPVFADLNDVPYREIPLKEDFTIDITEYFDAKGTVFIANPNAPTGINLKLSEIEEILKHNKENVVVVDEAYVDFGNESAVGLIGKYDNLLVTQTFSKSRSMAGARLGFGCANAELIGDLNTIKYSTNPYNINRMTHAAGIGALEDEEYTKANLKKIVETREFTKKGLTDLGFTFPDSAANFIFAKHEKMSGEEIYKALREKGILVRHFTKEKIKDYNRITVGSREEMETLLSALSEIIK